MTEGEFSSKFNEEYNIVSRKILRMLSNNSRMSISEISDAVSFSRRSVKDRIKKLEDTLGIRYTIELNEEMLGPVSRPHVIAVNFDSKPDYEHITKLLKKSYIPQVAVSVNGDFDMLIYAVATSSREYAHWDKGMQMRLSDYGADWRSSELIHRQLGFFPLRNEFISRLDIPPRLKDMLMILNQNSRASFQEISKQIKMHFNTTAYNFNKLTKTNYISRFTITMDKPKDVTLLASLCNYRPRANYEEDTVPFRKSLMEDDDYSLISRHIISGPMIGSYGYLLVGAFDDYDTAYKYDVLNHYTALKKHGLKVESGIIDKILLGRLPIRSIDTKEYKVLKWAVDHSEDADE